MEKYEWLVFTCRACRRVIKLAPAMAGKHVVCPHCRTKVTVPKDAPVIEEAPVQSHIPAARNDDGMMSQLRGTGREPWEVGGRATGGDVEFRERLHTTSAPEMQPDPDKAMRRVNMRRKKHESLSTRTLTIRRSRCAANVTASSRTKERRLTRPSCVCWLSS